MVLMVLKTLACLDGLSLTQIMGAKCAKHSLVTSVSMVCNSFLKNLHLSLWTRYFVVILCLDPTNGPLIQKKSLPVICPTTVDSIYGIQSFAEWYPALATPQFKLCHLWWVLGSEICSAFVPSSYLLRLQVLYVCIIKEEIHFLVAAF